MNYTMPSSKRSRPIRFLSDTALSGILPYLEFEGQRAVDFAEPYSRINHNPIQVPEDDKLRVTLAANGKGELCFNYALPSCGYSFWLVTNEEEARLAFEGWSSLLYLKGLIGLDMADLANRNLDGIPWRFKLMSGCKSEIKLAVRGFLREHKLTCAWWAFSSMKVPGLTGSLR